MPFDFRHLEAFVAVVRESSFTKAAESLGLSQPTVSETVANLERSLGVTLLDRLGRGVTPTEAGRVLARHARSLLAGREATTTALAALVDLETGSLRLACSTVPGEHILPAHLGPFHNRHPGIEISVTIGDSESVLASVRSGDAELGICGVAEGRGLHLERLWIDRVVLVAPPGHPLARAGATSAADLPTVDLLLREAGSGTLQSVELALAAAGQDPRTLHPVARLGSTTAIKEAVLGGLGVSFLSEHSVRRELAAGLLCTVEVANLDLTRSFHLVTDPRRQPSRAAEALAAHLLATSTTAPT